MAGDPTGAAKPAFTARIRRFLAARFDRKSQLGIGLTASVMVCALAIWALSGLLDAILDNDYLVRWDATVNNWFHEHATAGGLRFFDALTQLGSYGVVVVVVIVAILLWRAHARLLFWLWLGANAGGSVVEYVLKTSVHRSRPQYAAMYLHGHSYSFPSGHTMASTICYLLLAFLISSYPVSRPKTRRITWIVASGLVASIAFSRLYLGVHYPSDVLGGFAAGLGWLAMCGATRRVLVVREGLLDGGWRAAAERLPGPNA
jgi:membrane-associated phospholipid phosphatase